MEKLTNVGSALGKDIINLEDGAFVGTIQGVFIDAESRKVTGFVIKNKGLLGGKNTIAFENIRAIGEHMVTVTSLEGSAEGKEIRNMSVITADGTYMGKIIDFAFEPNGTITELILKDGIMKGLPKDRGAVACDDILTFGKDMVIAKEGLANNEFTISDEEVYGDWEEVDEILEDIEDDSADEDEAKEEKSYEEHFDEITDKISQKFSSVGNKIKEIDTDEVTDKIKVQSNKLTTEAKGLWGSLKGKLKSQKEEEKPINVAVVLESLKDYDLEKPLLNDDGSVLIWPEQEIDLPLLEKVIALGKLEALQSILVKKTISTNKEDASSEEIVAEEAITKNEISQEENQ